jgi:hypothetical protein
MSIHRSGLSAFPAMASITAPLARQMVVIDRLDE